MKIPRIATALAPCSLLSAHDPPVIVTRDGDFSSTRWLGPVVNSGLIALAKWLYRDCEEPIQSLRASLGLPKDPDPIFGSVTRSPSLTLGLYSPRFAPLPPDLPPSTRLTGFSFDRAGEPLAPRLKAFLESGSPPLIFTLGSTVTAIAGDFFLQSALAARALGERAILLTGKKEPGEELEPYLSEEIIAVASAPHALLFPRALAIVHQGGIGTLARSIEAGKPSLIVPFGLDQPDNAYRAVGLGIARFLKKTDYRAATVARELRELLSGDYPESALALGERVRTENGAATAAETIDKFLNGEKVRTPERRFTRVTFPDGSEISTDNPDEARWIYPQIDEYFRHGIEVTPGDVVFDAGANIGLFSERVDRLCQGSVTLHAFEPIPETFQLLRENSRRFLSRDLHLYPVALGRESGRVTLTYFPKATVLSTAHPSGLQKDKIVYREIANQLETPLDFLPGFLKSTLVGAMIEGATRGRPVICPMEPLSVYLDRLERVDLLKIDVEREELNVLAGIGDKNWPKIQQIVVEIHDIGGRARVIEELLLRKGFEVVLDREPVYERLGIYNAYAKRPRTATVLEH